MSSSDNGNPITFTVRIDYEKNRKRLQTSTGKVVVDGSAKKVKLTGGRIRKIGVVGPGVPMGTVQEPIIGAVTVSIQSTEPISLFMDQLDISGRALFQFGKGLHMNSPSRETAGSRNSNSTQSTHNTSTNNGGVNLDCNGKPLPSGHVATGC